MRLAQNELLGTQAQAHSAPMELDSFLHSLRWATCRITFVHDVVRKNNPKGSLDVMNGILVTAYIAFEDNKHHFFFHSTDTQWPEFFEQAGAHYSVELVCVGPNSMERIKEAINHLKTTLKNFTLASITAPSPGSLRELLVKTKLPDVSCGELCLEFKTLFACDLKKWGKSKDSKNLIAGKDFWHEFAARLSTLAGLDRNSRSQLDDAISQVTARIRILPLYWARADSSHVSQSPKSRGHIQKFIGCRGPLYLKGDIAPTLPLLLLCSVLHTGRNRTHGMGYYQLATQREYFDPSLGQAERYLENCEDLMSKEDISADIQQSLVPREGLCRRIADELISGNWEPQPACAQAIPQTEGSHRIIARLTPVDTLVCKSLDRLIYQQIDNMFDKSSIGCRREKSVAKLREMINKAYQDGFHWAAKSDIEDFFDNIDWEILDIRLKAVLPIADHKLLRALAGIIRQPLDGIKQDAPRTRGLLKGSPLSPLLANIYLDGFDEAMLAAGHKLVRLADDFLFLGRTQKDVEDALNDANLLLSRTKLEIKESKTSILEIDGGLKSLGMDVSDIASGYDRAIHMPLRKALYLTKPYCSVIFENQEIAIHNNNEVLLQVPLRRVSEIVFIGQHNISTRLIHECNRNHVPISYCPSEGTYHNFIVSPPEDHFDHLHAHRKRFNQLAAHPRLSIVRSLIRAKITNYIAWFQGEADRKSIEQKQLRPIKKTLQSLEQHLSIEALREAEGRAATTTFKIANNLCHSSHESATPEMPAPATSRFISKERGPKEGADLWNTLLDFAYYLLFMRINTLLKIRALDPSLGFLHSESLAYDLQEPFRAEMDRMCCRLVNLGSISAKHFFKKRSKKRFHLNADGISIVSTTFSKTLQTRVAPDLGTLEQIIVGQLDIVRRWADEGTPMRFFTRESLDL